MKWCCSVFCKLLNMAVLLSKGVFIVAGKRTPFGKFGGMLRVVAAEDLFAAAAKEAFRAGGVSPCSVDTVNIGQTCSLSKSSMSPRHAALKAGVPQSKPVLALNKLSGSGFHAVVVSAQEILTCAHISLAGGMENQSSIPHLIRDARFGIHLFSSITLEDWFHSSNYDTYCSLPLVRTADIIADEYRIGRDEIDRYAVRSHQRWQTAHDKGIFNSEVVPVRVIVTGQEHVISADESPRPHISVETLSLLPPLFKGGVSTAGNVCDTNDGAAALILTSEEALTLHNLSPLSRLAGWACVGVEPALMGTGAAEAVKRLLDSAKMTMDDVDLIEIHETFAAQALACARELEIDFEKLNVNGGAIAIGHPSGASGARLALQLTLELRRRRLKRGIAAISIAGGQGMALLLEAVE